MTEHIKPGFKLIERFGQAVPVKVAFWSKVEQKDRPHLYVATDAINDGLDAATHGEWWRALDEVDSIPPSVAHLIPGNDYRVADALTLRETAGDGHSLETLGSQRLGRLHAEDAYVYPVPKPAVAVPIG